MVTPITHIQQTLTPPSPTMASLPESNVPQQASPENLLASPAPVTPPAPSFTMPITPTSLTKFLRRNAKHSEELSPLRRQRLEGEESHTDVAQGADRLTHTWSVGEWTLNTVIPEPVVSQIFDSYRRFSMKNLTIPKVLIHIGCKEDLTSDPVRSFKLYYNILYQRDSDWSLLKIYEASTSNPPPLWTLDKSIVDLERQATIVVEQTKTLLAMEQRMDGQSAEIQLLHKYRFQMYEPTHPFLILRKWLQHAGDPVPDYLPMYRYSMRHRK